MKSKALLSPSEAGRILGVAPATVRQMARNGVLAVAARTEGGNRLFEREAVKALARKREAALLKAKRALPRR